jgi:hypothetical protein
MQKGWRRLGVLISVVWISTVSGYAIYEWQAPFFKKEFFFAVIPHSEITQADGAIFVTTPFLIERFIAIACIPLIVLWLIILLAIPAINWVRDGFKT